MSHKYAAQFKFMNAKQMDHLFLPAGSRAIPLPPFWLPAFLFPEPVLAGSLLSGVTPP
ncbi:MAG: hypothetical protein KGZ68_01885 [Dechloromonas sp.]|uniref:hypothetical protein n=1 Tax=Dechloromonas sp. CZR5 TaxID=2608630 RepID=UPI00168C05A3|nr:hypothetical protein [Dechloromonas sp. CZR5]MBS4016962.1 hypothetical protein [Dechloromonas sp.]